MGNGAEYEVKTMAKKKNKKNSNDPNESVNKRLDALIRIIIETLYTEKPKKFTDKSAVQMLNSAGLGPTEISNILGKKLSTITKYLYSKDSSRKKPKESSKTKIKTVQDPEE